MIPRWIIVSLAVIAAIPFGWGLGVIAAYLLLGRDFGVFPVLTIPLGWAVAIVFAVTPWVGPAVRLAVLAGGSIAFFAFGDLLMR